MEGLAIPEAPDPSFTQRSFHLCISHLVRCEGEEYLREQIEAGPALGVPGTCRGPMGTSTRVSLHLSWQYGLDPASGRLGTLSLSTSSGFGLLPHGTSRERRRRCIHLTPGREEGFCPELWLSTGQETT